MNSVVYAGVVAFGALTLVIEARRNYNVSAKHHPFAFYGILENLTAEHLCSPRDWNFGFYIYSLLYLFSYAFLLSSSELIELIYQSETAANLIGATDSLGVKNSDPFNLSGTDYGRPLFISAFIIAFYSIGATRNVELHIRTLAHRLAGVPRGVYQVLDRLHDPDFLAESKPSTGPLMDSFLAMLQSLPTDAANPNAQNTILKFTDTHLLKHAYDPPTGREQYVDDISKALRVIDLLRPAITGAQRATHFPLLGMDELSSISEELQALIGKPGDTSFPDDRKLYTLHQEILKFETYDVASLERLREKAIEVANSTRAVFAVYFISNSRTILNVERDSALDRVRRIADRGFRVEQNAFAGSMLFASFIAAVSVYAMITSYTAHEALDRPVYMAEEIEDVLHSMGAPSDLNYLECEPFYRSASPQGSAESEQEKKRSTCNIAKQNARAKYENNRSPDLFALSLFVNFSLLLMVAAVAQMSIFEREVRMDQNSWRAWSFRRVPYVRFLTAGILPTLAGVIALTIGFVLRQIYNSDFDITTSQIEFVFVANWQFFTASILPCFILCASVYTLIDKHDDWHALATILFAVFCSCLYFATVWYMPGLSTGSEAALTCKTSWSVLWETYSPVAALGSETCLFNSYKLVDVLTLALLPMLFLVFFAIILESSESVRVSKTWRSQQIKFRTRQKKNATRETTAGPHPSPGATANVNPKPDGPKP